MTAEKLQSAKRTHCLLRVSVLTALIMIAPRLVSAQDNSRISQLLDGAKKEGTLTIYGSFTGQLQVRSEGRKFLNRFKEKYPFIDLQLVNVNGTRVMQRVSNRIPRRTIYRGRDRDQRALCLSAGEGRTIWPLCLA